MYRSDAAVQADDLMELLLEQHRRLRNSVDIVKDEKNGLELRRRHLDLLIELICEYTEAEVHTLHEALGHVESFRAISDEVAEDAAIARILAGDLRRMNYRVCWNAGIAVRAATLARVMERYLNTEANEVFLRAGMLLTAEERRVLGRRFADELARGSWHSA